MAAAPAGQEVELQAAHPPKPALSWPLAIFVSHLSGSVFFFFFHVKIGNHVSLSVLSGSRWFGFCLFPEDVYFWITWWKSPVLFAAWLFTHSCRPFQQWQKLFQRINCPHSPLLSWALPSAPLGERWMLRGPGCSGHPFKADASPSSWGQSPSLCHGGNSDILGNFHSPSQASVRASPSTASEDRWNQKGNE